MRFDPAKVLLDPYGRGRGGSGRYSRDAAGRDGRQRRDGDEERGGGSVHLRLGRRCPAAAAIRADHHLRDARARLHAPSQFRRRREDARHVRRPDREDPVSAAARHHRRRTAAGVPVRRAGLLRPAGSTTGAMRRSRSSRRTRRTARARIRSAPVDEFRDMVKALHRAGIEVILDVVFNHTAEGDERGPTLCFRGLDNTVYYILEHGPARAMRTTPAPETRSTPTTRSCAG